MTDLAPTPPASAMILPSMAGRPAVVTGAGRGIGRAIALRLARAGADVCLAARTAEELDSVAAEVEAAGVRAVAVPCDLTVDGSADLVVETAVRELGGLSLLVNNAGGAKWIRPLDRLDERAFELGTTLNYGSVYRLMHAAAEHLFAAAPHAAVLNIVSIAAERGLPGMSYYSGAKAGIVALSRAVAREWGPRGVRVNCLGPGWTATELSRPLREDEQFARDTLAQVPLGRWGSAEEIADAAAFLLSDAAQYVTGTTLFVDGGWLA